jgi:multiple sugar transport system permease protein
MWAVVAVVITPLVWTILVSLKPDYELHQYPPTILPHAATLENYFLLFSIVPFKTFYINTVEIAVATSVLTLLLGSMAGYSMARFQNFGTQVAGFVGLAAYMLPGILIVVPIFRTAYALGALNSLPAIIGLYTAYFLPFCVWQLRAYFVGIPREIEDAAMVDGATRFEAFALVVLPQALPGLIATGVFCFASVWHEYLFGSLLLSTPEKQTLSVGLSHTMLSNLYIYSVGALMAGSVLTTLPILVVFVIVQRQLVAGLNAGSLKH